MSGVLTGIAGVLYAARLNNAGTEAGVGLEVVALTAAVLGGNSLGGGRGSIPKAVLGAFIVALFTNSLLRFSLPSGANPLAVGLILLVAVATDVRWLKNRQKLLSRIYVSPTYFAPPPLAVDRSCVRVALCDQQQAAGGRADRARSGGRRRGHRLRPRRQHLCGQPSWRHRAVHGARLHAHGDLRPYRRSAAGAALRR